ncbi:hypothetical protein SAMN05428988_2775 [Chitinophaga sp. YR573]|uniref:hypothetical protein n=1 Tax=Chitinophaga sp. YR573 TaxID=1881040 RepID=UPI0008B01B8D|nr:hypothetical protein [Chitinophaga sp. YR573]SEW17848.1 hypothetical protein SAMN05428988_2775 [Chitinophaga sp. YR573]
MQKNKIALLPALEKIEGVISASGDGLIGGSAGLSIFYHQLYLTSENESHLEKSRELITAAVEAYAGMEDISFRDGSFGVALSINYMMNAGVIAIDAGELSESIDTPVYISSLRSIVQGHYDFWEGGLGAVPYAYERLPDARAKGYLHQVHSLMADSKLLGIYMDGIMEYLSAGATRANGSMILRILDQITNIVKILIQFRKLLPQITGIDAGLSSFADWIVGVRSDLKRLNNESEYLFFELRLCFILLQIGNEHQKDFALLILNDLYSKREDLLNSPLPLTCINGLGEWAYIFKKLHRTFDLSVAGTEYNFWIAVINAEVLKGTCTRDLAGIGIVLTDYLNDLDNGLIDKLLLM